MVLYFSGDVMAYLGIDPSLNGTGLCLLSTEGAVLQLETVHPGSRRDACRLAFVKIHVERFLQANVKFVIFENYSYHSVGRVFELGEIGGVLRLVVYEHDVPYDGVAPTALKKFATGVSSADKDQMVAAAIAAGAKPTDDNQADAYHLACIARHMSEGTLPRMRSAMEVVHTLRNPTVKKKRRIRQLVKNVL